MKEYRLAIIGAFGHVNYVLGSPALSRCRIVGMAPGVDRMIMLIAEEDTIRDVIAFPLNGNAQDLMMGAPGEVTEQQLREVHIKVRD